MTATEAICTFLRAIKDPAADTADVLALKALAFDAAEEEAGSLGDWRLAEECNAAAGEAIVAARAARERRLT